jgi:hypothetical protein
MIDPKNLQRKIAVEQDRTNAIPDKNDLLRSYLQEFTIQAAQTTQKESA